MENDKPSCPRCNVNDVRKHGQHLGKQRYYCKQCGLAFTGEQYRHHPSRDITALRAENHRLLRCLEAARRLNAALGAYLDSPTGKALSSLNQKRERFSRLLADTPTELEALEPESITARQEPDKMQDSPAVDYSARTQGTLFDK